MPKYNHDVKTYVFDKSMWDFVCESDNFIIIRGKVDSDKKPLPKRTDVLCLLEYYRREGFESDLSNFKWDGTILFKKVMLQ